MFQTYLIIQVCNHLMSLMFGKKSVEYQYYIRHLIYLLWAYDLYCRGECQWVG